MSERGPERHDERPSFSPAATVVFAGIAAATVTMTASSVRQHGFRNAPGFNDVQGRVDNAPVERSPFGIQNPKKGSPVVQEQMGVVSGRVQSVSNDTVVNGESMVLDSGSRVSDGGNYGRNGGVKSLPEMKRGAGVKRSVKVPGLSRDADSKVSVVEAVRAKLDRRGKNLAALSEYQLQGIVHGAVEDVLKSGRLPLRSGITVRTFPDKLSEYRVDRLGLDGRIRDAIGEVSAGKKERRDEMRRGDRDLLGKDEMAFFAEGEALESEVDAAQEKDYLIDQERHAIGVEAMQKMQDDQRSSDAGYVEWIEGMDAAEKSFSAENVARSGGVEAPLTPYQYDFQTLVDFATRQDDLRMADITEDEVMENGELGGDAWEADHQADLAREGDLAFGDDVEQDMYRNEVEAMMDPEVLAAYRDEVEAKANRGLSKPAPTAEA